MSRVVLSAVVLMAVGFDAAAQDAPVDPCRTLLTSPPPMLSQLTPLLGAWESCDVERYVEENDKIDALMVIRWGGVKLSVEYKPYHASIYVVDVTGESPLTSAWYAAHKTRLVDDYFEMRWDQDQFLGPTSEYYLSKESGTNGQFWAERDKDGRVTWMRFSYIM